MVLGQLIRRLRAENRLPLTQSAALGRLDRCGPQSTADLAAAERVRPQSMSQTLAELESQGLIERAPDPADGRRALIGLTDAGRDVLADDRGRREGWLAEAIKGGFSPDEQELLSRAVTLLGRLTEM